MGPTVFDRQLGIVSWWVQMSYSQVKLGAIMTHRPDILESLQTSKIQETSEAWLTTFWPQARWPGLVAAGWRDVCPFQLPLWLLMVSMLSVWISASRTGASPPCLITS